jgi:hypothetical protein
MFHLALGNDHLTWRGGYGFFLKKYSDSPCCWKKYSDFGGGKKIIWFRVFVIYTNVKYWEKKFVLCALKKINILTLSILRCRFVKNWGSSLFGPYTATSVQRVSLILTLKMIKFPSLSFISFSIWYWNVFRNKIATPLVLLD